MTDIRYGTGREPKWHAMVSANCVLVFDRGLSEDRVRDLWSSVRDGAGAQPVLDALTRGGISSTPSFALAVLPVGFGGEATSITMVVRGALAVNVASAVEMDQISGEGVSTWVERVVPDATSFQIGSRDPAAPSKLGVDSYVLNQGSALIEWLSVGATLESQLGRDDSSAPASELIAVAPQAITPASTTPAAPPARVADRAFDPGMTITDSTFVFAAAADEPEGGYDFLFGETVIRTVEGAAVRDEQSEVPLAAGDHDGRTAVGLSAAERRAARQARQKAAAPVVAATPEFAITFSTGETEPLDRALVIGRAPSASKVSATSVPRLLTVGGPDQDISRNHVQVTVEGGTVLVTDLHSRNGTIVTLPGRPPQQLRGGHPTAVIGGAVIDLGSGISFTVGEN